MKKYLLVHYYCLQQVSEGDEDLQGILGFPPSCGTATERVLCAERVLFADLINVKFPRGIDIRVAESICNGYFNGIYEIDSIEELDECPHECRAFTAIQRVTFDGDSYEFCRLCGKEFKEPDRDDQVEVVDLEIAKHIAISMAGGDSWRNRSTSNTLLAVQTYLWKSESTEDFLRIMREIADPVKSFCLLRSHAESEEYRVFLKACERFITGMSKERVMNILSWACRLMMYYVLYPTEGEV